MTGALRGFIVKEFRHILRDRQTLVILLLLPLAQVILFGYALRTDVRGIRTVIVDPRPDHLTLALASRFQASDVFRVVATARTTGELPGWFRSGRADQAVVFPAGFAQSLARGDAPQLLVITDAADPNSGSTMQAYATALVQRFERELGPPGGGAAPGLVPVVRMRFNPTLESVNLFIPGLIALVLTIVTAMTSAISLSREKERGTLEVLLVSPLRGWQIILGKVIPYLVLGFGNVLSVLAAAWFVFRVPLRGSLLLLLAECTLYIVTSLALGVLIAAVTTSQRTAMTFALTGLMMPTTLLSGMVFPIESFPGWLQPFTSLVPGKWFILIVRGIMLKGVGMEHLWQETAILAGMTVVLLVASVRAFQVRLG
jgi:ABC-2 type transport system permease protein